jgi:hypothetical protein
VGQAILPAAAFQAACHENTQVSAPAGTRTLGKSRLERRLQAGLPAPQLQLDDSALQSDRDRVRPIVGVKFGEDVLDVALNGFFGDR